MKLYEYKVNAVTETDIFQDHYRNCKGFNSFFFLRDPVEIGTEMKVHWDLLGCFFTVNWSGSTNIFLFTRPSNFR